MELLEKQFQVLDLDPSLILSSISNVKHDYEEGDEGALEK